MKYYEVKCELKPFSQEAADLLSAALSEIGFEAFSQTDDGLTAYIPANADVKAGDRIEYAGGVYTITGEPRVWPSATGGLDHVLLNLERWSG